MKKMMIRLLGLMALAAAFALPACAQAAATAQGLCTEDARAKMYADYYALRKEGTPASQAKAYEIGKQYLAKYAAACPDQYTTAVQKFVKLFGDESIRLEFLDSIYNKKDYAHALQLGRQLLTNNPNDLGLILNLAYAAYQGVYANNAATPTDALNYVRQALQQIDSGKAPADWTPFKSKDEALSYLNYFAGDLLVKNNDMQGALPYLLKAATLEGPAKRLSGTYAKLAVVYTAQYTPMQQAFNAKFGGKPETDESKYELAQLNQVIDRIMDAYARAINLAGSDTKLKDAALEQLKSFYAFRHDNKTDGLDAYIASVANTALPAPFEPKPYVPPANGPTTPAINSSTPPNPTSAKPAPVNSATKPPLKSPQR